MSYAGAVALGFAEQGTAPVLVEALPTDGSTLLAKNTQSIQAKSYSVAQGKSAYTNTSAPKSKGVESFTRRISSKNKEPKQPEAKTQNASSGVSYYVQVGAFGNKENAEKLTESLQAEHRARIFEAQVNDSTFYRVRLGPVYTVDQTDRLLNYATRKGFKKAIIVVE